MKLDQRGMLATLPVLLTAASCVPPPMAAGAVAPPSESARSSADPVSPDALPTSSLRMLAPAEEEKWQKAAGLFEAPAATPALPFEPRGDEGSRRRSLDCLTAAIYYEARSESEAGQRAVAQVVLNRVRHPAFPASVCGVVYQGSYRRTGCQFTFTCDGSLRRRPVAWAWERARRIAEQALAGEVYAPVGNATHYHTTAILPYWASSLTRSAVVGAHIFYRWKGGSGERAAFRQDYAGNEPGAPAPARNAAITNREGGVRATFAAARSVLRVEHHRVDGGTVAVHRGAPVVAPVVAAAVDAVEPVEADQDFGVRVHVGGAAAAVPAS